MLRFLDAGESHGKALVAIIDGFPSNYVINMSYINNELIRRQKGYGRGNRMKIENDRVRIISGLRGNLTTGNPITLIIDNKDYENWEVILNKLPKEEEKITIPRPGHGDLVGFFKYRTGDIRNVIERTSARETAIRVAIGAMCKSALEDLGILIRSKVKNIGGIEDENVNIFDNDIYKIIESSEVRCFNKEIEYKIKKLIDNCKEEGDSIGGSVFLSIKGVPMGIGSFCQWDRKLDGILSYAIMSLQGIKAVEFGNGLDVNKKGSKFNDHISIENKKIYRNSNNLGGIESGVSNGENINITAYMKPIPSVTKGSNSIDLKSKINVKSRYERSDICAVVPASIVLENICAFEIFKEIMVKFPCDDFQTLNKYLNEYRDEIKEWRI